MKSIQWLKWSSVLEFQKQDVLDIQNKVIINEIIFWNVYIWKGGLWLHVLEHWFINLVKHVVNKIIWNGRLWNVHQSVINMIMCSRIPKFPVNTNNHIFTICT